MAIKAFQFAVTTKGQPGKRVFAVEAATEPGAQVRLQKDERIPPLSALNFERVLSASDIEKHGIKPGSIVQLR
jgi:hypothetical protein